MLVCIGAGASFGSLVGSPFLNLPININGVMPSLTAEEARPPLTQHLVRPAKLQNWHLGKHQACIPVVDWLRRNMGTGGAEAKSFEEFLVEYRDSRHVPNVNAHLTSLRFYVRDLIWSCTTVLRDWSVSGGITHYASLVNELYDWACQHDREVVFVVFNYDLLLEDACRVAWGMEWWNTPSYLASNERMRVLKPHGSIHWEHKIPHHPTTYDEAERVVVEDVDPTDVTPTFDIVSGPPWDRMAVSVDPALPAIALPMADKTRLEWPAEQEAFMKALEGRVTSVVAIGWRAAEAHFHDLLHAAMMPDCPVVVVTPDTQEGDNIGARIRPTASSIAGAPLVLTVKFNALLNDPRWRNFLDGAALRVH